MKQEFKNKVICFYSDSIGEHGYYMDYMRRYIAKQKEKCYIINRSIGGSATRLACNMIEDEIDTLKPDVVFVQFGGNDVGIYNYNANKPETPEILEKRQVRKDNYIKYTEKLVCLLKDRGIDVYLFSPNCTNERFNKQGEIETVKDNEDKAKFLKNDFYCSESYVKVNALFADCEEKFEKIAAKCGVGFLNAFSQTREFMYKVDGMFTEDGLHYSTHGHKFLAHIFLKFLGYDNVPLEFDYKNDVCSVINQLEQTERHIQFFKHWLYYDEDEKPFPNFYTDEDVKAKIKEKLAEPNYPFKAFAEVANMFYDQQDEIRNMITRLVKSL